MTSMPTFDALMNPTLTALRELGGSGTIEEINARVFELEKFSDKQLAVLHNPENDSRTEIEYRLAWTRTYLKKFGLLDNSDRGVWSLTAEGRAVKQVNPAKVKAHYHQSRTKVAQKPATPDFEESILDYDATENWRDQLMSQLLMMKSDAFERLIQRLLRESGFTQVEVTGRTGDGGIDGKGIMKLSGLIGFNVVFQCKRYKGTVSAGAVRDFRGASVGRADKSILITTGNFTKDAVREASRDGTSAIDLVDGDALLDILKRLGLGVKSQTVEIVEIDAQWFQSI